jgi:hypothetical protein
MEPISSVEIETGATYVPDIVPNVEVSLEERGVEENVVG